MRFCQIQKITEFVAKQELRAVTSLSGDEHYLEDHFPRFPVMPGVLMVESLFQAGMFFVLASERFEYSSVMLKEANHVKFNDFVQPGNSLEVVVKWKKHDGDAVMLAGSGTINGKPALKARLLLERFNLADRGLASQQTDDFLKSSRRTKMNELLDLQEGNRQAIFETGDRLEKTQN